MLAVCLGGFAAGHGALPSFALLVDQEAVPSTLTTSADFPPEIANSVGSKITLYIPGHVRQGGTYYVYANITDSTGVASATVDTSSFDTGVTAAALVAGSYTVGGVIYNYRTASLTADTPKAEGTYAYTLTAIDTGGGVRTASGYTVVMDNTRPTGANVQTTNAGVAGRPESGDTITYTFSEVIDPQTVLAGWTGAATSVVLRITNNVAGDQVTIRNAANAAQLPFGVVNLVGTGYVNITRDFGATGTPSSMVMSGSTITVTLGTASGAVNTQATGSNMTWVPTTTLTDRAGNTCTTTTATEATPLDLDF